MHADRRAGLEALGEVVALHHARHGVAWRPAGSCRARPAGRSTRCCSGSRCSAGSSTRLAWRVVGLGVGLDLLARQRRARGVAARRVADHRGEVADQEDHRVPQVLQLAHLVQHHGVADVDVGRGRVQAQLDAQRHAGGFGARQLVQPVGLRAAVRRSRAARRPCASRTRSVIGCGGAAGRSRARTWRRLCGLFGDRTRGARRYTRAGSRSAPCGRAARWQALVILVDGLRGPAIKPARGAASTAAPTSLAIVGRLERRSCLDSTACAACSAPALRRAPSARSSSRGRRAAAGRLRRHRLRRGAAGARRRPTCRSAW